HDPATFAVGLVLVALAPWNVGLWYVVSRLRLAIESDCDRHVVASPAEAERYARLLITVQERASRAPVPRLAFGERASNLERRVRWLVGQRRMPAVAVPLFTLASGVAAIAIACKAPIAANDRGADALDPRRLV